MTIAILYCKPGQTIARPFNRACNVDEALELISSWAYHNKLDRSTLNERIFLKNMDTENVVFKVAGHCFYAFIE